CGICPVAYQMSAVHAMEGALGVKVTGPLRALRRLLYCGEWIESHGLHVFMLHAPDFLGYQDALQMAQDHPETVKMGLRLKKVGNDIVATLGGREIHPINVRVGGFYKAPSRRELEPLVENLKWARDAAVQTVHWVGGLPFPDFEQDYEFVSLRHDSEYPFNEGRVVSNKGLDIAVQDYEQHFVEEHVPHSHALHSSLKARGGYFAGPLARYNLNFDVLTPLAQEAAREAGLEPICRNPFQSIIVRAVEMFQAVEEALGIIKAYEKPERPAVPVEPRAVTGCAATEAPRGLLYHRYRLDEGGVIQEAKIVPPTSQNQRTIEDDLRQFVTPRTALPEDKLTWQCEQMVRNYDPCISCATHFLKVKLERR
ncbi:MAG TPA: nickel-dependent hydrogenase large subunit, partial [Desulfobaccales bacterium]|nr:nickel-dependent hydrogenase large subunit [Desulfobaccales bacterium]